MKKHKTKSNFFIIILIFVIVGVIALIANFTGINICIFYNVTGVYCPSCGMTRSVISLMHLDFKDALMYNPMFICIPLIILPFFIEQFFFKIKKDTKNKYFLCLFLLILVVWIIRLFIYFPNDPMPYNPDNLLLHFYSTIQNSLR